MEAFCTQSYWIIAELADRKPKQRRDFFLNRWLLLLIRVTGSFW